MQLLNVIRARAIWLIYVQDINPQGKNLNPYFIDWLKDRYKFLRVPSSIYERNEAGALVFSDGTFRNPEGTEISVDLAVYNDGFIADTRASTKDTDAFIAEALDALSKDFGLVYRPEMLRKKLYVSELTLRTDRQLNDLNPRMREFIRTILSMVGADDLGPLELSSLGFGWDYRSSSGYSPFQFERVQDIAFSERRYYSRAPLQTADHVQLLNEFEDLLVG